MNRRKKFFVTALLICAVSLAGCAGEEAKKETTSGVEPEVTMQEIEPVELEKAEPGDYVAFGTYEQDNNEENGKEAIEWLVLAKEENKILVISKEIIARQSYNEERVYTTWEECTLRTWLNNDFISEAFSEEEKSMIPTVAVKAYGNEAYKVAAGNDTNDQVFLLAAEEIEQFFTSTEELQCDATEYAVANGAYVSEENGASWWWLRSRGYDEDRVMRVSGTGEISDVGERVDRDFIGVRPVMWIQY